MFNRFVSFIQQSDLSKFLIVEFIVALFLSISVQFSMLPLAALILSSIAICTHIPFIETKLSYDQKKQVVFNSLLLCAIIWAVYMWKDLQNIPQSYTAVFVLLSASALVLFKSLKLRIAIIAPLLVMFVILLFFIEEPTQSGMAILALITIPLLLIHDKLSKHNDHNVVVSNESQASQKLELVADIDGLRTENQQLQDHIKQIEIDLSAAEMAKMEFLATISHEIRTPLNGIIPLLDILLDSELSNFQRDYLSTAHISAIQMQKLIDDLLDYSKVEAGKLTVETRGLKIVRLLSAVNSSYQQAAMKKNLSIDVDVNNNVSPLLRGDPTRLRQVLSNLLSNAIKFSNAGTIRLIAKKIKDYPNKEVIRFEVIDQGIGLDKETCDNIFLPFTQEDGSSTRKFGGTGLGLAISKKIVELMNGTIGVESKKGKGSNFYFDLPLLKSVGETSSGLPETSNYQAILINTNPLLFNKVSQKLKAEDIPFQKALGISQAYEMYSSINKISKQEKSVLMFIDFETAGKQVRSLCTDITKDQDLNNLFACILSDNKHIAGIPSHNNIKMLSKDDSIAELLSKIEVLQASMGVTQSFEAEKPSAIENLPQDKLDSILPEILLVEDNEVNLKVAEKLIQYIGYPFDFAMNGQEALEKVKVNRYRMILMDCQMPVMDGYRCTSKIRDYEMAAGLNRTPILAMTANAMMGDREKCLDAGMDDYMSKPLNRYMLEKTLKKWDPLAQSSSKPQTTESTLVSKNDNDLSEKNPTATVSNFAKPIEEKKPQPVQTQTSSAKKVAALKPNAEINQKWLSTKSLSEIKEFMGDEIIQLLEMFEQETPSILKKLNTALRNGNIDEIEKMSHMLKSTSANIGANGLSFFSRKMELAAKNNSTEELPVLFSKVKKSYTLTSKEIVKYINAHESEFVS